MMMKMLFLWMGGRGVLALQDTCTHISTYGKYNNNNNNNNKKSPSLSTYWKYVRDGLYLYAKHIPPLYNHSLFCVCVQHCLVHGLYVSTGHTLVESMLFPCHFNEIYVEPTWNNIELTSVPYGVFLTRLSVCFIPQTPNWGQMRTVVQRCSCQQTATMTPARPCPPVSWTCSTLPNRTYPNRLCPPWEAALPTYCRYTN